MIIDGILIIIIIIQWVLIMRNRYEIYTLRGKVRFLSIMSDEHSNSIRKLYELGKETTDLMNKTVDILMDMTKRK